MQGLPIGYLSLLAGHGGVGKTSIAKYLAACIGAGRPFFGLPVERRRVLYLSCEDRADVLHWRLARICAQAFREDHRGVGLVIAEPRVRGDSDLGLKPGGRRDCRAEPLFNKRE